MITEHVHAIPCKFLHNYFRLVMLCCALLKKNGDWIKTLFWQKQKFNEHVLFQNLRHLEKVKFAGTPTPFSGINSLLNFGGVVNKKWQCSLVGSISLEPWAPRPSCSTSMRSRGSTVALLAASLRWFEPCLFIIPLVGEMIQFHEYSCRIGGSSTN